MLKILGAGLPRTGTKTLCEALRILGYNAIHHAPERVPLFIPSIAKIDPQSAWGDVEAAVDCPAAIYWREIKQAFPSCKVILTVRESCDWWESIKWHSHKIHGSDDVEHIRYTNDLHALLFGVGHPNQYWWRRRFGEHNAMVKGTIPPQHLLAMDIVGGDKWDVLCPFLGVEEPDAEWPWENRRSVDTMGAGS